MSHQEVLRVGLLSCSTPHPQDRSLRMFRILPGMVLEHVAFMFVSSLCQLVLHFTHTDTHIHTDYTKPLTQHKSHVSSNLQELAQTKFLPPANFSSSA